METLDLDTDELSRPQKAGTTWKRAQPFSHERIDMPMFAHLRDTAL